MTDLVTRHRSGWGQAGRAAFTWDDLGKALAQQGDCTVLNQGD